MNRPRADPVVPRMGQSDGGEHPELSAEAGRPRTCEAQVVERETNDERTVDAPRRLATCIECGSLSGLRWVGWRAYRVDDPEYDEPPALAFYCPACAEHAFGPDA